RVVVCEGAPASRETYAEKSSDYVVAVLLIGSDETVFQQQRLIGPATFLPFRSRSRLVCRYTDDDLGVQRRDQLKTLAAAVVVQSHAFRTVLPALVVAKLLLKPRCDRHHGSYPVRLRLLCCIGCRKPGVDKAPCTLLRYGPLLPQQGQRKNDDPRGLRRAAPGCTIVSRLPSIHRQSP